MNYELDLGSYRTNFSESDNEIANYWLNAGINQHFAFNHEEACLCYDQAIKTDKSFVLPLVLKASCYGPNYNDGDGDDEKTHCARNALSEAEKRCSEKSAETLKLLIAAQKARFADGKRSELDVAYAKEMRSVLQKAPTNVEVLFLTAEAMMQLRPWKLFTKDGKPEEGTLEIISIIEDGLKLCPLHPGLLHLHLHALEMSATPADAYDSCAKLRRLVPDAGHLLHMPSHIDVLVGDYQSAIECNERAVVADEKFRELRGADNFFTLYRMHDLHLLVFAAMFAGNDEKALKAATDIQNQLTEEVVSNLPDWLEAFSAVLPHVLVRFGKWNDILELHFPDNRELFCTRTATLHYARGIAYAALEKVAEAEEEQRKFENAYSKIPKSRMLFENSSLDTLGVAREMLSGELLYRKQLYTEAFASLREAVKKDDALPYDEPWGWMQPTRHALGALLFEQQHFDEAEEVFKKDLKLHPKNIWSLRGLLDCQVALKKDTTEAKKLLDDAEKIATVKVKAPCACQLSAFK